MSGRTQALASNKISRASLSRSRDATKDRINLTLKESRVDCTQSEAALHERSPAACAVGVCVCVCVSTRCCTQPGASRPLKRAASQLINGFQSGSAGAGSAGAGSAGAGVPGL